MIRSSLLVAAAAVFFLAALPARSMQRTQGWCERGGAGIWAAPTSGFAPVQRSAQQSFPGCTVTVYIAGTTTLASIYSDNAASPAPQSNPFTAAASTGYYYFYAPNGVVTVQLSGAGIASPYVASTVILFDPLEPVMFKSVNNLKYASAYPGSDCGAQINAAYADLPSSGGTIVMDASCSFSTPVSFSTSQKPALLSCYPQGAVNLTYTASTGTALTFNWGNNLYMGGGLRDCTLTGSGHANSTRGIVIGGSLGAQGASIAESKVQSFGTNLFFTSNTWITEVRHSMIRDGQINVWTDNLPSDGGENLVFTADTFADAPSPFTSSVIINPGNDVTFMSCSFDQAQLYNSGQSTVLGGHFENPNGGAAYDFITQPQYDGAVLKLFGAHVIQGKTSGQPAQVATISGGTARFDSVDIFTQAGAPWTNFAVAANNANIEVYGLYDLSSLITGAVVGGTTTGLVVNFAGANPSVPPRNFVIGQGATGLGLDFFDVRGTIRTDRQLKSTIVTGTAPIVVNSTTPVNNLFANPLTYNPDGSQVIATTHIVYGRVTMSGGTATVTLAGPAAYTNVSSYRCSISDESAANAVRMLITSGSSFTVSGIGVDNVSYICVGI